MSRVLFEFFAEFFLSGENKAWPLLHIQVVKAGVNSFKIMQVSLFNSTFKKNINNSKKKINVHVCRQSSQICSTKIRLKYHFCHSYAIDFEHSEESEQRSVVNCLGRLSLGQMSKSRGICPV